MLCFFRLSDASFNLSGSRLSQEYSASTLQSLEEAAGKCEVVHGRNLYIVSYGNEKEMCVRVNNRKASCECSTFKSLNICAHVIACVKFRGQSAIDDFIKSTKCPSASSQLVNQANAGKKPHQTHPNRKGGRSSTTRVLQSDAIGVNGGYVIVRGSSRIKVCNGCKTSLSGERFVIKHNCAVPFPRSIDGGGVEWVTPQKKTNHYFHVVKRCVAKSSQHKDFDGSVAVEPAAASGIVTIRELCRMGDLIMP